MLTEKTVWILSESFGFRQLRSADVLPSVHGAPSDERFAGQPRVTELPAEHRTKAENTGPFCITR